jgi:hypothetical protein
MSELDLILRQSRPLPPPPSEVVVARARQNALEIVSGFRSGRRRRVGIVAVAAAVVGLLASPVGIGGGLVKLLGGTPAPAPIRRTFDDVRKAFSDTNRIAAADSLESRYGQVIPEETRGLLAIGSVDGEIYLWVAPTRDGRECWLIQSGYHPATGKPYAGESCDGTAPTDKILVEATWSKRLPDVIIVHVRAYDDSITTVEIEVANGRDVLVPVTSGHALGTIPSDARPDEVVARDADGDVVARWISP